MADTCARCSRSSRGGRRIRLWEPLRAQAADAKAGPTRSTIRGCVPASSGPSPGGSRPVPRAALVRCRRPTPSHDGRPRALPLTEVGLRRWIENGRARVPFQGLPSCLLLGYCERAAGRPGLNELVRSGESRCRPSQRRTTSKRARWLAEIASRGDSGGRTRSLTGALLNALVNTSPWRQGVDDPPRRRVRHRYSRTPEVVVADWTELAEESGARPDTDPSMGACVTDSMPLRGASTGSPGARHPLPDHSMSSGPGGSSALTGVRPPRGHRPGRQPPAFLILSLPAFSASSPPVMGLHRRVLIVRSQLLGGAAADGRSVGRGDRVGAGLHLLDRTTTPAQPFRLHDGREDGPGPRGPGAPVASGDPRYRHGAHTGITLASAPVDVIPFVPGFRPTMTDVVSSRARKSRIGSRPVSSPVYIYADAPFVLTGRLASAPRRVRGLKAEIDSSAGADFGPPRYPHRRGRRGGARPFLMSPTTQPWHG